MKVISKKSDHLWWVHQPFTCGNCSSEIQLTEYDLDNNIITANNTFYGQEVCKREITFNCPVCKEKLTKTSKNT